MQQKIVTQLGPCTECSSEDRSEVKDAMFEVDTPMKIRARLCDEHFFGYVENRLGTNTVRQLVMVAEAGGAAASGAPSGRRKSS